MKIKPLDLLTIQTYYSAHRLTEFRKACETRAQIKRVVAGVLVTIVSLIVCMVFAVAFFK